jgi:hypothetical protein
MFSRSRLAAIILLLTFTALPAVAQEFGPGILPADTSFFIFSKGTAHAETIYAANPMVQSWNSPEFADFRQQGIAYLIRHSDWKVNGQPMKFTPAQTDQIFSILKSPMMFGFSGAIDVASFAKAGTPTSKTFLNAGGMFVILDVTGKTAQFDLLFRLMTAGIPKDVTHTHSDFSGVGIEKFAGPNNTSLVARVGNYFVWSNQEKVIQDLISRLGSHSTSGNSLAQTPNYQRCRANQDPDSISEVYFRIPDLTKVSIPVTAQFDTPAALRSLHLDAVRAFCGSYAITAQGEQSRGLVVGDTTSGGIFDFFGANRAHFDTLALAPQSAYSYLSYSFDLPAIYKTVRAAAMAALPQQQAAMVQMVEGMSSMQLGMPVNDVLALTGGEAASIQLDANSTPPSQIYAVSITNPEKVATLIEKLGTNSYAEDGREGGVTFFKSINSTPAAGAAGPSVTSYVALTPNFLLFGTDKPTLVKAAKLDSAAGTAAGSSLADSPEISRLRALLPKELLGLTITDYTRHDWTADFTKSIEDSEKSGQSKLSPEDIQFFDSMKKFNATRVGKAMLRRNVAGWWKEPDGIHYQGFSQ